MKDLCKRCRENKLLDKYDVCSFCLDSFLKKNNNNKFLKIKYSIYTKDTMIELLSIKTDYEHSYSYINRLFFILFLGAFPAFYIIYKLEQKLTITMCLIIILSILTIDKYIKDVYSELKLDLHRAKYLKISNKFLNRINIFFEFQVRIFQLILITSILIIIYSILLNLLKTIFFKNILLFSKIFPS